MAATKRHEHRNVVVIVGTVVRTPEIRELADGRTVIELDVKVTEDTGSTSVPVSWIDGAGGIEADTEVVVVGRVRRRFWQSGGAPLSRTDVVADLIVPSRPARRASAALADAARRLA